MTTPYAIVTGSRKYGIPKIDSDLDIVVYMDIYDAQRVQDFARTCGVKGVSVSDIPPDKIEKYGCNAHSIKFGPLNLIIYDTIEDYEVWTKGTTELLKKRLASKKPIKRSEAVALFSKLRNEVNDNL